MSIDRLERRLPEVLTELSLPSSPPYIDNLLSRTERMPQRPGWTFPERWFPVSTITDALAPGRPVSFRPLIAVALVLALIVASIAFYVGSQQRVPPPFGLARNGLVVTHNETGDLITVDAATEASRTIVAGPNLCCVDIAPDGQRLAFLRLDGANGEPAGIGIANVDGSGVHDLAAGTAAGIEWFEWAPASQEALVINRAGAAIIDAATGDQRSLDVPFTVARASWMGTTGDVLLTQRLDDGGRIRLHRLAAGTSTPTELMTLNDALDPPLVSPDGSRFLYVSWGAGADNVGRIHVVDLASGEDRIVTPEAETPAGETTWLNAVWSPDGSKIAAERYTVEFANIAVIPAAGGEPTLLGPDFEDFQEGAVIRFAPDGTQLLVTYRYNGATWLLPISGAEGRVVSWVSAEEIDWQRLAP